MISINNLTKVFNDGKSTVLALEDISLCINDKDIFGIIGMSGAGKSTLLRCLSMLEAPSKGTIFFDGVNINELNGAKLIAMRRKMGVVFQGYSLLMQKTVKQNIMFPLELAKMPKEKASARAQELLEIVSLQGKSAAYPSQLSGGQKQRVAIARALASQPEVLLCDEPTSALDSLTTKSMLELLSKINKTIGVTIIIITHEIGVVKSICNKVAVIDSAHIVENGYVKDIFANPQSEITRMLLGKGENDNA